MEESEISSETLDFSSIAATTSSIDPENLPTHPHRPHYTARNRPIPINIEYQPCIPQPIVNKSSIKLSYHPSQCLGTSIPDGINPTLKFIFRTTTSSESSSYIYLIYYNDGSPPCIKNSRNQHLARLEDLEHFAYLSNTCEMDRSKDFTKPIPESKIKDGTFRYLFNFDGPFCQTITSKMYIVLWLDYYFKPVEEDETSRRKNNMTSYDLYGYYIRSMGGIHPISERDFRKIMADLISEHSNRIIVPGHEYYRELINHIGMIKLGKEYYGFTWK